MTELSEKEQQQLNTGRMMRAESDLILPLLQTKERIVIGKIVASFRAGEYGALTGHAAELSTLDSMKNEITQKIKLAEALERKAYAND
jgi:hypothetical protein